METIFIYYIVGLGVALAISYYLIKGAVFNAIIEANEKMNRKPAKIQNTEETVSDRVAIERRFNAGEITLDEATELYKKLK